MSAAAPGIVVSTTRAPSRCRSSTQALGGVARLRLPPIAELRRLAKEPDREPIETGCRDGTAGEHRPEQRDIRHRSPHRPDRVERRAEGEYPVERKVPPTRFEANRAAGRRRQPDRAPCVGSDAEVDEARREGSGVPRRGATRRLPRMQRVVDGAVPRIGSQHPPGELGQVALADDDRAAVEGLLHDRRMPLGHVIGEDLRAVRRPDARRVDQILDEQGAPCQRPVGCAPKWLVEPGDSRVVGVGHGITATASISTLAPGIARPVTSTSEPAGRVVPSTRRMTLSNCGRSSTTVR